VCVPAQSSTGSVLWTALDAVHAYSPAATVATPIGPGSGALRQAQKRLRRHQKVGDHEGCALRARPEAGQRGGRGLQQGAP